MPEASTDRLQLAVDWFFLALVFDDINCDERAASTLLGPFVELAAKMLSLLEAPSATARSDSDVFISPAQDIAYRAWQMGTPTQIRRVIDAYRAWCFGVLWEFGFRSMSTHPSVNDYAYMRQHTAGGLSTICWTEIVNGNEIPEHELSSPAVRALTEIALTTAFLDNDLFSYGKEKWVALTDPLNAGNNLNLVEIMIKNHGMDTEQALIEVADLCNRLTFRFIGLRDQIATQASTPLHDYLDHLSHLVRGNIEWGLRAPRFTNPDGHTPNAVTTTITWTETAPSNASAPPIPSIAWWWDVTR